MSTLLDLLNNNFLFTGVVSNAAYAILNSGWTHLRNRTLEDLYLDAFKAAVRNARPNLARHAAPGDAIEINHDDVRRVLYAELSVDVTGAPASQLTEDEFIQRAAYALAEASALTIGGHVLTDEDYRQVLRNLLRHAGQNFRSAVATNEQAFRAMVLEEAQGNRQLLIEIQSLLTHGLGIEIDLRHVSATVDNIAAHMHTSSFMWLAEPHTFFSPYMDPTKLFNHGLPLVGHRDVLNALDSFVTSSDASVLLLIGPGGAGKSKMLKEFAWDFEVRHPGTHLYFAREGAFSSDSLLPEGECIVVVDDAQRWTNLPRLLLLARDDRFCGKLLLATRPEKVDLLQAEVAHTPFRSERVQLPQLSHENFVELARSALGTSHADLADALVTVTGDSPLVTVVAARLLTTDGVNPLLLQQHEEFRSIVLSRFHEVAVGAISERTSRDTCRAVLALIAAIEPIQPSDALLLGAAADYLGIHCDTLEQALDDLMDAGVLYGAPAIRIMPGPLSDHILYEASYYANGQLKSFLGQVFDRFWPICRSEVLSNLAAQDWRVHRGANTEAPFLPQVWPRVVSECASGSYRARCEILDAARLIATIQPGAVMQVIETALGSTAQTCLETATPDAYYNEDAIMLRVVGLLPLVGLSPDYTRRCCETLWRLGRGDIRPTAPNPDHPMRLLIDLAGYDLANKRLDVNRAVLDAVEGWTHGSAAFRHPHSPLDVLKPLLAKNYQMSHAEGMTIHYSSYRVPPDVTGDIRSRAIALLSDLASSPDARSALRAIDSLGDALTDPFPYFGNTASDEEIDQWVPEQTVILTELTTLAATTTNPLIHLQIGEAVDWHAKHSKRDSIRRQANAIIDATPDTFEMHLTEVLFPYSYLWRPGRDNDFQTELAQREQRRDTILRAVASEFIRRHPQATDGATVLDSYLRQRDVLIKPNNMNPAHLLCRLVGQDLEYGSGLCDATLEQPERPLAEHFHTLLICLREYNKERAREILNRTMTIDNSSINKVVALSF